jgi:hypothetical protein
MFKQFEGFKEEVERYKLCYNECIIPKENFEGKITYDAF